ncbi:DNA-3-methyladenine glycosylase I [Oceanidesulfovibrio indonesiensis]|uniref:DNA-3-methyladenine glycosylase I n=1 Tax=Oceanidesulfovibrio indonesiensis TaxID=54767 RepID=A0A7M3MH37_9BACT|nr:DNA-3-methyladenine glycosylase I [Oceanidesulfovibrio indonesiensis]TVM18807.1 DNA-3-methyladenine glycosylase I [Oceanidesulfovibrio indonesiensis]
MQRCDWAEGSSPLDIRYHDEQWGVPVHEDRMLFEMLILEGAQAGLSWSTILRKREGYRQAFDNFDAAAIAGYSDAKIDELRRNPAIIRNKAKIDAAVTNARCFLEVQKEYGSFDAYIWSFVGGAPVNNDWKSLSDIPATSPESENMSKDLKRRGFKFVGPTICYAFMQAVGMVNDHLVSCFRHQEVRELYDWNEKT